jgi:hypothetical protein
MSCFTAPSNIIQNLLTRLYDEYSLKIKILLPASPASPPAALEVAVVDELPAVKVKTSCGCLYEFKIFRRF